MKKLIFAVLILAFAVGSGFALDEGRFFRYPTVYQDKIAFTYEGDLWLASAQGGRACRITSYPGTEYSAKFSPDGKWIAFSATYDGASAVYIMPGEGGAPVRADLQARRSPRSSAGRPTGPRSSSGRCSRTSSAGTRTSTIAPVKGGAPERFPLDRGTLVSFSPDGTELPLHPPGERGVLLEALQGGAVSRTSGSTTATPRRTLRSRTTWARTPTRCGSAIRCTSSPTGGTASPTSTPRRSGPRRPRPVTTYADFDVMWPNTDGRNPSFTSRTATSTCSTSNRAKRRKISRARALRPLGAARPVHQPARIHPRRRCRPTTASPSSSKPVATSFRSRSARRAAVNLSNTPGTREMYPAVSPDGKRIAFFSDKTGDYQLYLQPADGGEWTPLTTNLDRTVYHLLWSPDGKKILFGNKDFSIFFVDVAAKKLVKIDSSNQMKNDEFYWEISDYAWSPDSKWITYSFVQYNRNSQIFIYNIGDGKKVCRDRRFLRQPLPAVRCRRPVPLFRLQPELRRADGLLRGQSCHRRAPAGDGRPAPGRREAALQPASRLRRHPARSPSRRRSGSTPRDWPRDVSRCPSRPGTTSISRPARARSSGPRSTGSRKTNTRRSSSPGAQTKWSLHIFDMDDRKDVVLNDKIRDFGLSANGEQLIIRARQRHLHDALDKAFRLQGRRRAARPGGLVYRVDLQKEWNQIFNDAWRWYRDFFYDAGSPRPRLEGDGREVPRLHPLPLLARRAELADVPDGGRAVRLPHVHRGRRFRAGGPAQLARVHRPAGGRPGLRRPQVSTSWTRSTGRPTSTSA